MPARHVSLPMLLLLGMALILASPGAVASPQPAARAGLTSSVAKTTLVLGKKTKVTGTLTPKRAGVPVFLQIRQGKTWSNVVRGKTKKGGSYKLALNPRTAGKAKYRVLAKVGKKGRQVTGPAFTVRVYRWYDVRDPASGFGLVDYLGIWENGTISINGNSYPYSTVLRTSSSPAFFEFNTKRKCSTFTAMVGAWDEQPSDRTVSSEISGDGNVMHTGTYALGDATRVRLNISNVLRMRIAALKVGGPQGSSAYLGVGRPRVLCMF